MLNDAQIERYSRQILLKDFGLEEQLKLLNSKVAIIGIGALGCNAALYLNAAGIGSLSLIDYDNIALSNLQRQILFQDDDITKAKVSIAKERLSLKNKDCTINAINQKLDTSNAEAIIKEHDFIINAVDNFPTRYLINDLAVKHKTAVCHAALLQYQGQILTYSKDNGCYRCLFPENDNQGENCNEAGVHGPLAGIMGSLQASECIKYLTKQGTLLTNTLLLINLLTMDFKKIKFTLNNECIACNNNKKTKE